MQHKSWDSSLGFLRVAASSNLSVNPDLAQKAREAGYLKR